MNQLHLIATKRRSAFTLIELLVVIAIIAVLVGLLMAGVMYALRGGPIVVARNDMSQLSIGLQRFKSEYKAYPPNTIKLCSNYAAYDQTQALDRRSIQFINRMYPLLAPASWTAINWANRSPAPTAGSPSIDYLDGDQCLVFFLAGPPLVAGQPALMGGFSNNALNPVDPSNPPLKKYFDFDAGRLFNRAGNAFPSFEDAFGTPAKQPYVYFSAENQSIGSSNRYDTAANGLGVTPYYSQASPQKFLAPDSFQLICAGPDGAFGPGGLWIQKTAGLIAPAGKDDYTNFHDKIMGAP